jgi:16S rRNA (guanine966-N2)-methyltransferase
VASPKRRPATGTPASYPGKIRIIGGQWRGRKLPVLAQEGLRPTPDRVRETLFNWLMPVIEGARCLDLFAGTGALCLEALSRGAGEVVMIERAAHVAEQLRRNIATLDARGAEVIQADAAEFLAGAPRRFDVIFLDPPFASDLVERCGKLIEANGWLKPGGFVYVEAPRDLLPLPLPAAWQPWRDKTAGAVHYALMQRPH